MKKSVILFFLCLLSSGYAISQVSHGGKPLPVSALTTRAEMAFEEMPSFDVAEQLRLDSLNESDLRSGFHFAYKFMTDYTPDNSGSWFTQADGTRVWRLGIRSQGAYSINILFSEYDLPEGAQLFLYDPDQTQVLGAFNHLNNSELKKLPVSPVDGDALIIEYQEPANAAFHGKLKVGEVNHDYRGFRGYEPKDNNATKHGCMNPLVCYEEATDKYNDIGRSVVLIVVNGETACSGTLINNTLNDGKPYMLTASHCLNNQFTISNPDYEAIAGNIIMFFKYESPVCDPVMRGTEELSMASTHLRAINENTDIALLELTETPPAYYQPYYAGWNAKDKGEAPYVGLHHPNGSVKRLNTADDVELATYPGGGVNFIDNGHWHVKEWTSGSTAGGSSGSGLFDNNNRLIGGLSGGESSCPYPYNDYYFAISQSWEVSEDADKQLKVWLDPLGENEDRLCDGIDPYGATPCIRLSNIKESGKQEKIEATLLSSPESGAAFGNNSLGMDEFAEAYNVTGEARVFGAYIVNPAITQDGTIDVEITIYNGNGKPEALLHSESFKPSFISYNKKNIVSSTKPLSRDQETFVTFSSPVYVSGDFFIGYKIRTASDVASFSAYNLPQGETTKNTTWINYQGKWIEATNHPALPMSTSLFVDPVIQYGSSTANAAIDNGHSIRIFTEKPSKTIHVLLPEAISKARYSIISMNGTVLQHGVVCGGENSIAMTDVAPGIYLIQVVSDKESFTQKILF